MSINHHPLLGQGWRLGLAWLMHSPPMYRVFVCRGADTAASDGTHRRTPLHWAALAGAEPVVRLLLAHGAKGAAVDKGGATPMDLAVEQDCAEAVQAFLRRSG